MRPAREGGKRARENLRDRQDANQREPPIRRPQESSGRGFAQTGDPTGHPVSVVVFHPSVAPPVQQAARAIYEAGQLDKLVTTIRDDPTSPLQRLAAVAGRPFGRDFRGQFRRRAITEVPAGKVETHPWGEFLRLATGAIDRDGRMTDFVWERSEASFDKHVARGLSGNLTGVYGYEHSSRVTFEKAKELSLKVAYEVPAPESQFVHKLLAAEMERFPELKTPYHSYTARLEDRRTAHRRAEWHSADVVIAASTYIKQSFVAAGLDVAKVRIIPFGAPVVAAREVALKTGAAADGPPVFLWAGTFGIRKGAHHVLEAWRKGGFGRNARLKVFGTVALPERILRPVPEGIELCGTISRPELMAQYCACDALLFPTLCDGFGMVVTEAWSCGLPVITTDSAGAADLLKAGKNGLLIPAGSPGPIAEALDWCILHRSELRSMREGALNTAAGWQWPDYRLALAETLRVAELFGPSR